MNSNYPPGVTGNEPEIAGYEHLRNCPLHEDNDFTHNCGENGGRASIQWSDEWLFYRAGTSTQISFCPFCGDELYDPECQCDELRRLAREDAILARGEQ